MRKVLQNTGAEERGIVNGYNMVFSHEAAPSGSDLSLLFRNIRHRMFDSVWERQLIIGQSMNQPTALFST